MHFVLPLIAACLLSSFAVAQTPYAGLHDRPIKALSEQQVADLNAGRGMGLALPAELNGYPGPAHVIELSDKLQLTPDQLNRVQAMFAAMKAEAIPLGQRLIAQEREFERQFSAKVVTAESLKTTTAAIAATQGELREAHLKYHLGTTEILTPAQMKTYAELRGYGGGHDAQHHQGHHPK